MFEDMRDLYQETILARARAPRFQRAVDDFDASGAGDNPLCGDRVRLWLRRDAAGRVADIGFAARGCHISLAAADLMSEAVLGRNAAEIALLDRDFRDLLRTGATAAPAMAPLLALSGVHDYPSRQKCATLAWDALLAALRAALRENSDEH